MPDLAVQTTMTNNPDVGRAGMPYDSSQFQDVVSCRAQEAIPFGAFVRIVGTDCELPDSSGEVTGSDGGVALATQNKATQAGGYAAGDIVPVMRAGRVWVPAEELIAVGTQPFIRFTTNAAKVQGGFAATADTARAVQKPGVTVYRGVAAAGLMVVQLNGQVGT
ncbi:MAG: hypothetical protein JWM74_2627 [Myxococcaceae bacterium]|nr:hypothetical protein [Myxococcaceae bacterium]